MTEPVRSSIRTAVVTAGFRFAAVDLAGVQSGAFTLPLVQINHGLTAAANCRPSRPSISTAHNAADTPKPCTAKAKRSSKYAPSRRQIRDRSEMTTLFTRADQSHAEAILGELPGAMHDPTARLVAWPPEPGPATGGLVVVVAAGTSDLPVAREALLTARYLGRETELVVDVGVAGLHRILGHLELLRRARVVIVAAGMDGALPSVVAGPDLGSGRGATHLGGIRRCFRRGRGAAGDAQRMRTRCRCRQHRQWLRGRSSRCTNRCH